MIKKKNKKSMEEKDMGIENGDPIKIYIEDSMQLLIHKHLDKQRGEI